LCCCRNEDLGVRRYWLNASGEFFHFHVYLGFEA
jgi:hypothetical protein